MNQVQVTSRRDMWINMLLYPGHTLPTAAAPAIVAVGLAVRHEVFAVVPLLLAFLAGWLVQLGGVLTDNSENLTRHPNGLEQPPLGHPLRDDAQPPLTPFLPPSRTRSAPGNPPRRFPPRQSPARHPAGPSGTT